MTTISTPSGTPSIIYNKSGITVDNITAAGTTQGTGATINDGGSVYTANHSFRRTASGAWFTL